MRLLGVLPAVLVVACSPNANNNNNNCTPFVDAGPRTRPDAGPGEVCATAADCAAPSTCSGRPRLADDSFLDDTASACSGTAATCSADAECRNGAVAGKCQPGGDAGTPSCAWLTCSALMAATCPSGFVCDAQQFCCPPGAPCAAPRSGLCVRPR